MEQESSETRARYLSTQVIPHALWNPNVHYRLPNSPPLVLILSQLNPVYALIFCFFHIHLTLLSRLRLGLPCSFFPSGTPTTNLHAFLSPPMCHIPGLSHLPWLMTITIFSFLLWLNSNTRVYAASLSRFRDHTQTQHTWKDHSGRWTGPSQRDLYLTTHNICNRQTSTHPVGFEFAIPAAKGAAADPRPDNSWWQ
jgi:hypothetical protein